MPPENQSQLDAEQTPRLGSSPRGSRLSRAGQARKTISAILLIVVLLVVGAVSAYFALNLEKKSVPEPQVLTVPQNQEKIVYRKVVGQDENRHYKYDLIISNVDGTDKETLIAGYSRIWFIFSPERSELISIDVFEKIIEVYSLLDRNKETIFEVKDFKPDYYIGVPRLSPDQKKMVVTISKTNVNGPSEIVLIDLANRNIKPKIIYSYPYEMGIPYWDSQDRIYGWRIMSAGTCGPLNPKFVINSSGHEVNPPFDIEEFSQHSNRVSPDGNYFASFQENSSGPYFVGMCDFHANGILKIYSAIDGSSIEIENNPLKEYVFKHWTSDSKNLVYQINIYPDWSGDSKDVDFGYSTVVEGFVAYNLDTKEKEYFENQGELDLWLKSNDPKFHIVEFSETTSNESSGVKSLHVNGKLIDSIGTLPWSFGGPGFEVFGFITETRS